MRTLDEEQAYVSKTNYQTAKFNKTYDKMKEDLKDALIEIENRGARIIALESTLRGLLDLTSEVVTAKLDQALQKKAKRLFRDAKALGVG